jgi:hypothetical protein
MQQPMFRPTLVLATILYLLTLLPAILLAPFAGFLFDSNSLDGITYTFATLWFSLPATLVIAILGGWFTHVRMHPRLTTGFLLLPIAHACLMVITGILHFAR